MDGSNLSLDVFRFSAPDRLTAQSDGYKEQKVVLEPPRASQHRAISSHSLQPARVRACRQVGRGGTGEWHHPGDQGCADLPRKPASPGRACCSHRTRLHPVLVVLDQPGLQGQRMSEPCLHHTPGSPFPPSSSGAVSEPACSGENF